MNRQERKLAKQRARERISAVTHGELCAAVSNGEFEKTKALIHGGASPNQANRFGITPLLYATIQGHYEIASWLIEHGADVDFQTPPAPESSGLLSALHLSAQFNRGEIANLLFAKDAHIDPTDGYGATPLITSIDDKNSSLAIELVQRGADINCRANDGRSALFAAAANGDNRVVDVLLSKGADPNVVTELGWTILHAVASNNDCVELDRFIRLGLQIDQRAEDGATPLITACISGATLTARGLLTAGANPNSLGRDGWTSLFYAIARRSPELVRMLLESGASVSAECANPISGAFKNSPATLTPRELARRHPDKEVIRLLDEALSKTGTLS